MTEPTTNGILTELVKIKEYFMIKKFKVLAICDEQFLENFHSHWLSLCEIDYYDIAGGGGLYLLT